MTRKVKTDLKTTWDCREVLVDGKLFAALTAKAQRRNTPARWQIHCRSTGWSLSTSSLIDTA